ncbi:MAG: aminotransferase class V-fold PLP-dependent enzyme [Firmicutes bacterium]|nr:aminotransferase class V-fold PLP-dependent enzyme [Bacillota bacterium]
MFSPQILLPGPTPIPEAVQKAMLTSMSDHRGALFAPVVERVQHRLADLLQLEEEGAVAVIPASGTGALEAAVQNFFRPGQRILSVSTGAFGDRFAKVAESHGLLVDDLPFPWGQPFSPHDVMDRLRNNSYVGILVTQNETSTGVLNPIKELAQLLSTIPPETRPLYIVDSISGVPSVPMRMKDWGIDVVLAASQKGFMCPPGLAIVAAGGHARELSQKISGRTYYFDLAPYFQGQLPYTPAVSLWYGLDAALALLTEEGTEARYARHRIMAHMAAAFAAAVGWTPIVASKYASPTVTAIRLDPGQNPQQLRQQVFRAGLQIAGGMGPWHHDVVRIGHVGAVSPAMLYSGLGIIAHFAAQAESGLNAAWEVWHNHITI